jgi:hypothetical protein
MPPGTATSKGNARNITVARNVADKLDAFRPKLSAHLGVDLTVTQCLAWLINHAERALPTGEAGPSSAHRKG